MPSCLSISPTDCCDDTSRLNIARRFGSAMISNTDSTLCIYRIRNIRVKAYNGPATVHRIETFLREPAKIAHQSRRYRQTRFFSYHREVRNPGERARECQSL